MYIEVGILLLLNILVVEDELQLRKDLEKIINSMEDMRVIDTAQNGSEALESIRKQTPDLVLMDVHMPMMDGITCMKEIRRIKPHLPVLIHTAFNKAEYILEALTLGANGYLLKGLEFDKLIQGIRDAVKHQFILPAEVATKLVQYVLKHSTYAREKQLAQLLKNNPLITKKEQKLIQLLLERLSNKEIAEKLFLSEGTVKNHLTVLYNKLGVHNRREAIHQLHHHLSDVALDDTCGPY